MEMLRMLELVRFLEQAGTAEVQWTGGDAVDE